MADNANLVPNVFGIAVQQDQLPKGNFALSHDVTNNNNERVIYHRFRADVRTMTRAQLGDQGDGPLGRGRINNLFARLQRDGIHVDCVHVEDDNGRVIPIRGVPPANDIEHMEPRGVSLYVFETVPPEGLRWAHRRVHLQFQRIELNRDGTAVNVGDPVSPCFTSRYPRNSIEHPERLQLWWDRCIPIRPPGTPRDTPPVFFLQHVTCTSAHIPEDEQALTWDELNSVATCNNDAHPGITWVECEMAGDDQPIPPVLDRIGSRVSDRDNMLHKVDTVPAKHSVKDHDDLDMKNADEWMRQALVWLREVYEGSSDPTTVFEAAICAYALNMYAKEYQGLPEEIVSTADGFIKKLLYDGMLMEMQRRTRAKDVGVPKYTTKSVWLRMTQLVSDAYSEEGSATKTSIKLSDLQKSKVDVRKHRMIRLPSENLLGEIKRPYISGLFEDVLRGEANTDALTGVSGTYATRRLSTGGSVSAKGYQESQESMCSFHEAVLACGIYLGQQNVSASLQSPTTFYELLRRHEFLSDSCATHQHSVYVMQRVKISSSSTSSPDRWTLYSILSLDIERGCVTSLLCVEQAPLSALAVRLFRAALLILGKEITASTADSTLHISQTCKLNLMIVSACQDAGITLVYESSEKKKKERPATALSLHSDKEQRGDSRIDIGGTVAPVINIHVNGPLSLSFGPK